VEFFVEKLGALTFLDL